MKLPELKQNLRTLNTNPVDLAVIEYVTPYKICVAALLHEYVRTHHMLLRILNFLFIMFFLSNNLSFRYEMTVILAICNLFYFLNENPFRTKEVHVRFCQRKCQI